MITLEIDVVRIEAYASDAESTWLLTGSVVLQTRLDCISYEIEIKFRIGIVFNFLQEVQCRNRKLND